MPAEDLQHSISAERAERAGLPARALTRGDWIGAGEPGGPARFVGMSPAGVVYTAKGQTAPPSWEDPADYARQVAALDRAWALRRRFAGPFRWPTGTRR